MTKTVKKNKVTLTKLKKNTKYQVKVRAYRADSYNDWYEVSDWANWSATKVFKTAQ